MNTNDEYKNETAEATQCARILEHLRRGLTITAIEALELCGCFRLSARIHDLRHKQGIDIITERVTRNGKTFAQYRLA